MGALAEGAAGLPAASPERLARAAPVALGSAALAVDEVLSNAGRIATCLLMADLPIDRSNRTQTWPPSCWVRHSSRVLCRCYHSFPAQNKFCTLGSSDIYSRQEARRSSSR